MIRHAEYLTREISGVKKPSAKYECEECGRECDIMIDGHNAYGKHEYCDKCEYSEWTDEEIAMRDENCRCADCPRCFGDGCNYCLMLEF